MAIRIWIKEMKFNNGSRIRLEKDDIVVFVGPNNAGKSASLKESFNILKAKKNKGKVVEDIEIEKEGDESDLFKILEGFTTKDHRTQSATLLRGVGFTIWESAVSEIWADFSNGMGDLLTLFSSILNTEQRLQAANPPTNIEIYKEPLQHPIHFLQKNDNLERQFSEYFRQAFGYDLIVHRNAGSSVPLYVGNKPKMRDGDDRFSYEYTTALEKLDLLHEQGDGMRSFVGVLLNAFVSSHSIMFIDEPEAFLHPPQAKMLGKMLAKDLPTGRQLFLATHSEDFLKGLLDSNAKNLKIIRIQRNGETNQVSMLTSIDITSIWDDPLLRHSNVLNGLFHSKVVLCESDSDCRFYSAILSAQFDDKDSIAPDVLFIHCGGKHRMPIVIKSLKRLDVPLVVISDFDIINDINPLRDICQELGGIWEDIESDWRIVKTEVEQKKPDLLTDDVKKEIESILASITERNVPKEKVKEIQRALKKTSVWSVAKEVGKSYIPAGHATQAFDRVQIKLKAIGLLVLEVGELESFVKSVGNHGPKWVSEVLTMKLRTHPELEPARQFVRQIITPMS